MKEEQKRIAQLEFQNDQLLTELEYINRLLCQVGFEKGLASLKLAALELVNLEYYDRRFEEGLPDEPPGL